MVADSQLAFALEILRLLSERSLKKAELVMALSDRGFSADDLSQKITRTMAKLRDCGFEIRSAPNRPYELVESNFPVILSPEQQAALALAGYFLSDMGFSAQASQIIRIGKFSEVDLPTGVKVNFSPPVDYSEDNVGATVQALQDRFSQKCRYTIRYRSNAGNESNWDCSLSELRLHNGVLYLFAYVPDFSPRLSPKRPSIEQNLIFRVDRIVSVRPASDIRWSLLNFPADTVRYRMSGPLRHYQPRRSNEAVLHQDPHQQYVDIEAIEDSWFWFRQRILQYGANAKVLTPDWMAKQLDAELKTMAHLYSSDQGTSVNDGATKR